MKNNIGHNSVQIPHDGKYTPYRHMSKARQKEVDDGLWAMYDARKGRCRPLAIAHDERGRLIRKGVITTERFMKPQMLIKDENGRWAPELKFVPKE